MKRRRRTKNPKSRPVLRVKRVSKIFADGGRAVSDVSFDAVEGELIVILGESGCGKTTTLKMINRLIDASNGSVEINGQNVSRIDPVHLRRTIGYVFQGIGLFSHMTVAENVGITPALLHWDEERIQIRVDELLAMVRLEPEKYRNRMPAELSGGQQQRVGFARALATSPSVILLDEPFGALDPITRDTLQHEFKHIQRSLNLTGVLVTHDVTEALLLADRILVMKSGTIVQFGTARDLVASPASLYVAELMDMPKRQMRQLESVVG